MIMRFQFKAFEVGWQERTGEKLLILTSRMPFLPSVCEENLETAILKLISRRTIYNNDTGGITIGSTIL